MSGTQAWVIDDSEQAILRIGFHYQEYMLKCQMIIEPQAKREYGSRVHARNMLRRDRVLQGVRRSEWPVLHTPSHTGGE